MEPLQPDDPRKIGPYRVVARLGAGGMGVVYLGRSRSGRPVAIKMIHSRFVAAARYRARFRREVEAARAVAGTFTAPVLDADPDAAAPWLVTAYLPGPSLREAIKAFGPLPPDAVRALAVGLAEALAAIHRGGLVHRDLKPANVLLTADGPRVIDFGIARPDGASVLTRAGAPIGSPGYMAPEQVRGEKVGPSGDVFTLGATLAYAATGVDPFGDGPVRARHLRVVNGEAELGAIAEPWLRELVVECLVAEPSRRPSAAEVLDRLGRTGADEPSLQGVGWLPPPVAAEVERRTAAIVPAAPAAVAEPPWRPGRRTVLAGLGAGALALAAASVPLVEGAAGGGTSGGRTSGGAAEPEPSEPPPQGVTRWKWPFDGEWVVLDTADGVLLASVDKGDSDNDSRSVHAFDPRDGSVLWERADTGATVAGQDVYLTESEPSRLRAVRASSGDARWTYDLTFGESTQQLAVSGRVVCLHVRKPGADEPTRVRALGRDDGKRRWTSGPLDDLHALAVGAELVVAAGENGLTALEIADGRARWSRPMAHGDYLLAGRNMVFAWDRLGTFHALRAADGSPAWSRKGVNGYSSRLGNGLVYLEGTDGEILALEAATGRRTWSRRVARLENDPRRYSTALFLDREILYAACSDDTLYALDAADGRIRWTYQAEAIGLTVPASADGLVFVATKDGHVRAIAPPESPGGTRAGS